jgi:hypothetical protein
VLSRGLIADTAHGEWTLVVELDEHGGAVDAILKDAGCVGAHDPCKVGSVEIQCSKLDHFVVGAPATQRREFQNHVVLERHSISTV